MSIYVGSNVKVADKTGAKKVLIICLFKNRKKVDVAQTIKSVCKKAILKTNSGKKLAQKGKMYNVVLVRQKKPLKKPSGNEIFFKSKAVVLLNKENESLS
jgi:ribosomal protein L14